MDKKPVYKKEATGKPLITSISSGCRTPLLQVKFSNLITPFYYSNSQNIPRYSMTCIVNPEKHSEFLNNIQNIEKNEKVESILKRETERKDNERVTTENLLIKFQTKEIVPIFMVDSDNREIEIELQDELSPGEYVSIVFDIMRYTKKNTYEIEHGISYKTVKVYYYPNHEEK